MTDTDRLERQERRYLLREGQFIGLMLALALRPFPLVTALWAVVVGVLWAWSLFHLNRAEATRSERDVDDVR